MVAETRETMTKWFDSVNDGFRSAFDAGRRMQETFFKTVTDTARTTPAFETVFSAGDKVAREFGPFFGKNVETAAQTFDVGFRSNMDMFRAACDATMKPEEGDVYKRTRKLWDTAFDAFRANMDQLGKTGTRTIENCTAFCQAIFGDENVSKPASKTVKA